MVEINCPPDCPHLAGNMFHRVKALNALLTAAADPGEARDFAEAVQTYLPFMQFLESSLVDWLPDLKTVTDREAGEAFRLLRASYETEARGLFFQESSPNPLVQALIRHLRAEIERLREGKEDGEERLPIRPEWIAKALRGMEIELAHYASTHSDSPQAYLSMLWRAYPGRRAAKGGSGLILASS